MEGNEKSVIVDEENMAEEEEDIAAQEFEDFLCSELENFEKETIRTKEALMISVASTRQKYQEEASSKDRKHSVSFYTVLDRLLLEFERQLSTTVLPEPLNEWWSYSYIITSYGVKLMMNYNEWTHDYGHGYTCKRATQITVLEVPAKMLSVSEYAAMNGVETVTVRQWIRRAKIRSVVKYGREWLIPELTEPPRGKGYTACRYYWKDTLTELPPKLEFLNNFKNVCIEKCEVGRGYFLLSFNDYISGVYQPWSDTEYKEAEAVESIRHIDGVQIADDGRLIIPEKLRAEIELYLIGNPVIHQTSQYWNHPTSVVDEYGAEYCGFATWIDYD